MPQQANAPLPQDFILENYRIGRQISSGGFSLVYLGYDEYGDEVAIKEYLPASLSVRGEGQFKPVIGEENLTTFRYGMKCFFEEGRALARLSHPNVVRVLNFFRANDTVYLVMQYEDGKTLQEMILEKGLKEDFLRQVFGQMLNGLREVHAHKLLHLDIKPANMYVRKDGSPVLLDFGAARQTLTEGTTRTKPMYTPGFASPEQYRNRERLGPWSDIYSVGATLYSCVTGSAPQPADARVETDLLVPAKTLGRGKFSDHFLETVDWCLKLDYLARPQTGFQLQKALSENLAPPPTKPPPAMAKVTNMLGKLFQK